MMIAARELGFRFAPGMLWLFRNLSFSLTTGQTLALLGRNGRGKTTLLKCLANLLNPTAGVIKRGGMIGYVPQQFSTPFSYSVYDVVLMGRARHVGLFSNPSPQDHARTREALDLVGL
ncbi:MAG: ABC transporter ATP-binding protein, partial [Alphaproteobacteria bacterium]|nr:ABC transporter ATP-binding protein [Alphaproteobacteria bacterium]